MVDVPVVIVGVVIVIVGVVFVGVVIVMDIVVISPATSSFPSFIRQSRTRFALRLDGRLVDRSMDRIFNSFSIGI